ncbi:MAG: phosphotransacetylase family protein [Pseudomonadota bacterium]
MVPLYISSTSGYSGKNLVTMGIGARLKKDGYRVGYMKPLGTDPVRVGATLTDGGASFLRDALGLADPLDLISPVLLTHDLKVRGYGQDIPGLESRIVEAYRQLSADKDVMLLGGAGNIYTGAFLGISGAKLIKKLGLKVILIDKYEGEFCLDCILAARDALGNRLIGVILNAVTQEYLRDVEDLIVGFLHRKGIEFFGALPQDDVLASIKVEDLAERLRARILCCHDRLDGMVRKFLIGGMNVDRFLEYYRKSPHNAVIVGGDRSDVQMVALEGRSECLILTGDFYPSDMILARAEERGVPVMLVRDDTYTVTEKIQRLGSTLRLKEPEKVQRAIQAVNKHVNFEALYRHLGLK